MSSQTEVVPPGKRTLFTIDADLTALADLLEEAGGEVTTDTEPIIDGWMQTLLTDRDRKIDGYCSLIRDLETTAAVCKEEAERYAKRARVKARAVESLKYRLKAFMAHHGLKKLETQRFRVSVCGNGGKQPMQIDDGRDGRPAAKEIPCEFTEVVTELRIDADAVRAALEAGEKLEFARLLSKGTHLRVS